MILDTDKLPVLPRTPGRYGTFFEVSDFVMQSPLLFVQRMMLFCSHKFYLQKVGITNYNISHTHRYRDG